MKVDLTTSLEGIHLSITLLSNHGLWLIKSLRDFERTFENNYGGLNGEELLEKLKDYNYIKDANYVPRNPLDFALEDGFVRGLHEKIRETSPSFVKAGWTYFMKSIPESENRDGVAVSIMFPNKVSYSGGQTPTLMSGDEKTFYFYPEDFEGGSLEKNVFKKVVLVTYRLRLALVEFEMARLISLRDKYESDLSDG